MIRRFLYHGFWNFYDHLGPLILCGALYAIAGVGAVVLGVSMIGDKLPPWLAVLGMTGFQYVLLVLALAALLPFCAKAARGEPARMPDLFYGVRKYWPITGKLLIIYVILFTIIAVNFNFYLTIQNGLTGPGLKFFVILITAIVSWTGLALIIFATPLFCAATYTEDKISIRTAFRKAFMAAALLPGLWILLGVFDLALLGAGVYTRIGLIFIAPVMASLGQTIFQMAVQFAGYLADAKAELGDGHSLRVYKKRAMELCWQWEHRQPRRTAKELIRPWDY